MLLVFLILFVSPSLSANTPGDSLTGAVAHFFDSIVPLKMQQTHIPCLVVSVVKDNHILFEKGYGEANLEKKMPADPRQTVWRIASISKVITATAVMQLVDEGKLDLDRDVNDYLKGMKVPEKFGKPITLRNLLTHTAGFDDRYMGKSFHTKAELPSLQSFLQKMLPARIEPPGELFMYSNLGNALAALVVQDVSGQDYNEYCRQHIFIPLGMKETSFRLNPYRLEHLYQGYVVQGGQFRPFPFDYLGDYPAGQLLSSADEFSRFMMCQLNDGSTGEVRILKPGTTERMQSTQFTQNPKLNGSMGLAFNLFDVDGNKVAGHDGGYLGVATRMWLLPERKTGFFMATNVMNNQAIENISYAFVHRFFNHTQPSGEPYPLKKLPEYDRDVVKYTGYYRTTRYPHDDFTKISLLFGYGGSVRIWKNDSGMLMMPDYFGNPRRLIQVQPGVFQSVDDDYYIAFKSDANGQPKFLFTAGTAVFEKTPEFYARNVQLFLLGSLLTFFILVLLARFVFLLLPKRRKSSLSMAGQRLKRASTWTAALFVLHWLGMGLVFFVLHPAWELSVGLAYGVGPDLYVVQSILILAVVFLILTLVRYFQAIGKGDASAKSMVFYTLFLLLGFLYTGLLYYWNVLGFKF